LKQLLKNLLPPLMTEAIRLARSGRHPFTLSPYANWEETLAHCTGYDAAIIFQKVLDALLKVKRGEAVYERDSVLFDRIHHAFPVLAGLLRVALAQGGELRVVDFGGSLGSSYFAAQEFLAPVRRLRWAIVEQERFVRAGREQFANHELVFYDSLAEAVQQENPQVILLSSVLQYLPEPYAFMAELPNYHFASIIIDRTPFVAQGAELLAIQRVPKEIYDASYPAWFFREDRFLACFRPSYDLVADFSGQDAPVHTRQIQAVYKGFILQAKSSHWRQPLMQEAEHEF
jgi:putative methyltransferase (TIGR04325 family)